MSLPVLKRAYPANQFVFVLDDGSATADVIRSVKGGGIRGEIIEEGLGNDLHHAKHVGLVEAEPITLELGMALSKPLLEWIKRSWKKNFTRLNGEIIHADFDYNERLSQAFFRALVTNTTFPTLDGSSRAPAYLTVSLHPEDIQIKPGNGKRVKSSSSTKQKLWTESNFELDITGIDCTHVSKIDSFSVTQNVRPFFSGEARFAEIEPTSLKFDNLTIYMALEYAKDFIKWHRDYVVDGRREDESEKNGSITFLDQSGQRSLFSVVLNRVGIFNLEVDHSEAGSDQIKRCKVELYVESMDLEYGDGMG